MGLWVTARDRLSAGAVGIEHDHALRVLRGDTAPVDVAIHTVACDMTLQQQIIDGGYEIADGPLAAFLTDRWAQMAGVVAGDLSQEATS
jgi:hypothetical protein